MVRTASEGVPSSENLITVEAVDVRVQLLKCEHILLISKESLEAHDGSHLEFLEEVSRRLIQQLFAEQARSSPFAVTRFRFSFHFSLGMFTFRHRVIHRLNHRIPLDQLKSEQTEFAMARPIKNQPHMNPYDYHKYLINEYVLKRPGDTKKLRELDKSKWKTDKDVIYENMKFIWNEDEMPATWEEKLAKKYYDKLFKEYCICDLSRYKENMIANRFRVEKEVVTGKGQFICGEKACNENNGLRTWEVNFSYVEAGSKKNTLVKLRKLV